MLPILLVITTGNEELRASERARILYDRFVLAIEKGEIDSSTRGYPKYEDCFTFFTKPISSLSYLLSDRDLSNNCLVLKRCRILSCHQHR